MVAKQHANDARIVQGRHVNLQARHLGQSPVDGSTWSQIADGESQTLVNEIVDGKGPFSYTTYQYSYAGGLYYLDVIAPSGTWSVTFTPA